MKPINIISAYQSIQAAYSLQTQNVDFQNNLKKGFSLSLHESNSLCKFVDILKNHDVLSNCFNGYYIGYSIKQISKEFDLLRFSDDLVINIELKGPLDEQSKLQKITTQMSRNHYYLNFLEKEILIFTYIEDDGLYFFDSQTNTPKKVSFSQLIARIKNQNVNYSIDPNNLFIPSNYLISPFNNTDKFLSKEYFLTNHQENIKTEILKSITQNEYKIFCISANAGTGKTLLMFDIAKHLKDCGTLPLIIHCGKLNNGHEKLNACGWHIFSIKSITPDIFPVLCTQKLFIIDESQRISEAQLDLILKSSIEFKIPILFSYDIKQYLKTGETKNIHEYITTEHPDIPTAKYELKNKIRTNKEMASFIKNLIHIGDSNEYLNYESITIEYFKDFYDTLEYIDDLQRYYGWTAITFTTSRFAKEPIDKISTICGTTAHDVIGQEFKKVVLVLDSNFKYNDKGVLMTKGSYYSATGMLYQIVTRAVDELKILVLNNPSLFLKLLEIKYMSDAHVKS